VKNRSRRKASAPTVPNPGRPLPLADQYAFTAGGCASFARAAQPLLGGTIGLLHAKDPRHTDAHDHPRDVPMYVHVVVVTEDGHAIDAEGRRSIREMARAFGVKRGYDYAIVTDPAVLREEFPNVDADRIAKAADLIREHGWEAGVPEADGRLIANWTQAIREHDERSGRAVQPTKAQARLYNLTPWFQEPSWGRFERLEVRAHETHGFVVAAIPSDPDEDDELITAAATEEDAVEAAYDLASSSMLDFDPDDVAPCMR
jgi:hypothetical protein